LCRVQLAFERLTQTGLYRRNPRKDAATSFWMHPSDLELYEELVGEPMHPIVSISYPEGEVASPGASAEGSLSLPPATSREGIES